MSDIPWFAGAAGTHLDADGDRVIFREGSLAEVIAYMLNSKMGVAGVRIALPDAATTPRLWRDRQVEALLGQYHVDQPGRARPFTTSTNATETTPLQD